MKVSVIVPVYNTEKYLKKCLDSLASQTLKEIEIIIINDGSTDNSQKMIDEYQKKYSNFKGYIKKNGGLSSARNEGIKYATGEYIGFVDSDDYVDSTMYEEMYNKAKENDYDMVACDINYVYPDKVLLVKSNLKDTKDIKKTFKNIYPAVCPKIFKKSLFDNNVFFKIGVWYEDVEFIYRMLPFIKSIGAVDKPFYQYLQIPSSITNTVSLKNYDYIDNFNGILAFYHEKGIYDEYQKELEYVYVRYLYATFIKNALKYDYDNYLKAYDSARENVLKNFPHYRRNSYFYQSVKGLYLIGFNRFMAKMLYKVKGGKK